MTRCNIQCPLIGRGRTNGQQVAILSPSQSGRRKWTRRHLWIKRWCCNVTNICCRLHGPIVYKQYYYSHKSMLTRMGVARELIGPGLQSANIHKF